MGIFENIAKRNKVEPRDMSIDKGREKFILDEMEKARREQHVPATYYPDIGPASQQQMQQINFAPVPTPMPPTAMPTDGVKEYVRKNSVQSAPVVEEEKEETKVEDKNLDTNFKISIVLSTKSTKLLQEMIDGISQICDDYGSDTLIDFKIEKDKKDA